MMSEYNAIGSSLSATPTPAGVRVQTVNGVTHWRKDGLLHRIDNPAVIHKGNVHEEWWQNGVLHRENGPAITDVQSCSEEWYLHGKRHREDGPALTDQYGYEAWWVQGKLHRIGGPAVVVPDGPKSWFLHGQHHRLDGPAVEHVVGGDAWIVFGVPTPSSVVKEFHKNVLEYFGEKDIDTVPVDVLRELFYNNHNA